MNREIVRSLPKIELHLHLEGAIPLPALWALVKKYGGDKTVPNLTELEQRFRYRDFEDFISTWVWKNNFIRELEDFTFIADAVAASLAEQHVLYAELFYSPGDFARHGLTLGRITEAIRKGLDRHQNRVVTRLLTDLIRDFGPELGCRWAAEAAEVKKLGVVGIGLGGSEPQFPPEAYADVYQTARALGFRTTAHAGEAAGPASVWGAIRALGVDRIGHGTTAAQDPILMRHLAQSGIAIEACPLSNVRTGAIRSLAEHPIRRLLQAGLRVTVNTDDPTMFNTSLEMEFMALHEVFGFGYRELRLLTENALAAAFCDASERASLCRRITEAYAAVT